MRTDILAGAITDAQLQAGQEKFQVMFSDKHPDGSNWLRPLGTWQLVTFRDSEGDTPVMVLVPKDPGS